MRIFNHTGESVWVGLYTVIDTRYSGTILPWGRRDKIEPDHNITVNVNYERVQVVFWTSGAFGSMLAYPKTVYNSDVSIAHEDDEYFVYNTAGAPRPIDKVDHVFVLMLENRSFDNLLGWLYSPSNRPPINIPPSPTGEPTFDGLAERTYWNTRNADEHDTAPEGQRIYARLAGKTDTRPDPNPREVCPSFVEQMFGTAEPAAHTEPNMWGFVANYSGIKKNNDVSGIMECYGPDHVPVISWLARNYAVCDRWFGCLPSETWPNRSFVHAGTSFGRLNNCNGKNEEDCIPNFAAYAGKRTIFDLLDEQGIRWAAFQDAVVVGTLLSSQFFTIPQKLTRPAYHLEELPRYLRDKLAPKYIWIEPSYISDPNDQHPPHKISSGETLLKKVYDIVSKSPVWKKSLLVITYDEHGGCYDHVPPPKAAKPDSYRPQFSVGEIDPFMQLGPRVPAVVVSPYVEAGTVFRAPTESQSYDHTSILASLREWILFQRPDFLSSNPRVHAAPVVWDALTRKTARPAEDAPHGASPLAEGTTPGTLTEHQLSLMALAEADRRISVEVALGGEEIGWQQRMAQHAEDARTELDGASHVKDLPSEAREALGLVDR